MWVSPFGDLRIDGYLRLPEAYRSLSRPSSALSAKASTLRSFCLTIAIHLFPLLSFGLRCMTSPRFTGIAFPASAPHDPRQSHTAHICSG